MRKARAVTVIVTAAKALRRRPGSRRYRYAARERSTAPTETFAAVMAIINAGAVTAASFRSMACISTEPVAVTDGTASASAQRNKMRAQHIDSDVTLDIHNAAVSVSPTGKTPPMM